MYENQFFRYLETEKRCSVLTLQSYIRDISQFSDFCQHQLAGTNIENAALTDIRAWIVSLMDAGYKASSVNRKLSALKSMYRFFVKNGIIGVNPLKKLSGPKQPKNIPSFVEMKGMENLGKYIFPESFCGLRDKLIIELLYQTGMRRAELLGIRLNDFDRSNMTLKLTGKRNKQRIVPVSHELMMLTDKYIKYRNDAQGDQMSPYLFITEKGEKMYPLLVYRIVRRYISMISAVEKQSPHVLRHTFATHMLNNGADLNAIKELLGHANLAATQVYTHNTFEKLKKIYKQAHPRA